MHSIAEQRALVVVAEMKEFKCLFIFSRKTKYRWENVLGNLTIDNWKIRQFNSMNH